MKNTKTFHIYAGGEFVDGKPLPVTNPYDDSTVAKTFYTDEKVYEKAIKKAEEARKAMALLPSYKRYEILLHIAQRLTEEKETLASILSREAGKPLKYARAEVERSIQTFTVAAEEAKRVPKEYLSLDWTKAGEGREGLVKYFPAGIVAGISPFNFPLNLAVHKIAPAIAAGCPIVLKPASSTPLSSLFLARIVDETDLPKGALSILPMDREFGNRMVTDERFAVLSFTGSPDVGWKMKAQSGKKKTVLELGGNAAVIISDAVELDEIITKCVTGGFAYQGQVCIHAQRFFVHDSIIDKFIEKYNKAVKKLKFGAPDSDDTDFTAMIDRDNADRITEWTSEAEAAGAELLLKPKQKGNFIHPTVIVNAKKGMKVYDEEVFGPVVTINSFKKFEDAIKKVNDSRFGLQAGIFTDRNSEIEMAFNGLETGGVILNDSPILRLDHMPYGGVKDSGLGREGVKYAMLDMLEPRILVK
jgi:acyl-CoA reductase-like NAD-dependent aldehyde dehydrogenase